MPRRKKTAESMLMDITTSTQKLMQTDVFLSPIPLTPDTTIIAFIVLWLESRRKLEFNNSSYVFFNCVHRSRRIQEKSCSELLMRRRFVFGIESQPTRLNRSKEGVGDLPNFELRHGGFMATHKAMGDCLDCISFE
ncbi:unnamed protein product [Lathyrus oleraceus]|uniref:uncharacterized protein LOC127101282 n=1 Tax=Pisum sativum TaxID=3888 RepID=UPI001FC5D80A|nr:uncharacterized protein LOC127101282 [Pisum sativum]